MLDKYEKAFKICMLKYKARNYNRSGFRGNIGSIQSVHCRGLSDEDAELLWRNNIIYACDKPRRDDPK